jgi:hypothetical protein
LSAEADRDLAEAVPRNGGNARELSRIRHVTMRHLTTSFHLLTTERQIGMNLLKSST